MKHVPFTPTMHDVYFEQYYKNIQLVLYKFHTVLMNEMWRKKSNAALRTFGVALGVKMNLHNFHNNGVKMYGGRNINRQNISCILIMQ